MYKIIHPYINDELGVSIVGIVLHNTSAFVTFLHSKHIHLYWELFNFNVDKFDNIE